MPPFMCAGNFLVSLRPVAGDGVVEDVILFKPHVLKFWAELAVVTLFEANLARSVFSSVVPFGGATPADPQ